MALRVKHFIGLCVAGCVFVALWTLPPTQRYAPGWDVRNAEQLRLERLEDELKNAGEVLRRLRWSDSLSQMVTAPEASNAQVLFPDYATTPTEQKARLAERVAKDVEQYAPSSNMRFAMVWQDERAGFYEGMNPNWRDRVEYFAGVRNGTPYCMTLRSIDAEAVNRHVSHLLTASDRMTPRTNVLGLCSWYMRYGLPSASIEEWLSNGAALYSLERGEPSDVTVFPERWLMGLRASRRPIHVQQCQAGIASGCAEMFETPRELSQYGIRDRFDRLADESPLIWRHYTSSGVRFSEYENFLFHAMESEFGSAAFQQFWTSEGALLPAFEDAFGVDAGEWVASWVESTRGVEQSSPALPRSASTGSMLAFLLFLGIVYRTHRRRAVA